MSGNQGAGFGIAQEDSLVRTFQLGSGLSMGLCLLPCSERGGSGLSLGVTDIAKGKQLSFIAASHFRGEKEGKEGTLFQVIGSFCICAECV